MSGQKLEEIIEILKHDKGLKVNHTIKRLRPVLKAFMAYSTTSDQLPPPTLIPVCLFVLPKLFKSLLDLQQGECLQDPPEKPGLKLCLQLYLRGLLRLLGECEEEIKHIVVQSMTQSIELVKAFSPLCKKWMRALVGIWANCSQNLNLGLRCFVCLQKVLRGGDEQFYIWGLRRIYMGYFQHCGQLTWRTLEHINFMGNCFCQIVKFHPDKAYYVLFGYIRSIAMQIQGLNNSKSKEKQELTSKLYSMQTLQILRLLGQVVGKGGEQISAITYPLAELLAAYERISECPEYIPLKLHLLQFQLQLMQNTGLYLPHTIESIVKILRSSPLQKKHARKAGVEGSIELGYKFSFIQLKHTQHLNDIFDKTLFYLYWLSSLVYKMVGGVEITRHVCKLVQAIQFGFSGHRKAIKEAVKMFKADSEKIQQLRSKKKFALGDEKVQKFEAFLSGDKIVLEGHQKYRQLMAQRESLFKAKVLAQQDEQAQEASEGQNEEQGDDDELDSGWEQASEGASEFEQPQAQKVKREENEDISYEGDPDNPDEAIKEWSQHQWSSQQQGND